MTWSVQSTRGLCVAAWMALLLAGCPARREDVPLRAQPAQPGEMFHGVIDLGRDEGTVDFAQLRDNDGVRCVIHCATRGLGPARIDPDYARRERAARDAGIGWGAYHFGDGLSDPEVQADFFLGYLAGVARTNGTLDRPVLTILDHEGRDRMTLRDVALFARRVQAVTGRYPGLYVNRRELAVKDVRQFTGDPATAGVLSQCWLWVADYSRPEPWIIEFPAVWERWTLWQYTGDFEGGVASAIGRPPFDGQVSAGAFRRMGSRVLPDGQRTRRSVDRNLFSGTAAEWEAFHATNATAPATWRWNGAQPVR